MTDSDSGRPITINPHDRFFRHALVKPDISRGFFQRYLSSEVVDRLDLDTLTVVGDSFIDESLKFSQSDLVFSVKTTDERSARLYLLLEHKSYPDPWVGLQLLGYVVRLWEREKQRLKKPPLPAVIPMVLYQGEKDGEVPAFEELVDYSVAGSQYAIHFPYGRCLLGQDRLEELEHNPQLDIVLNVLKYIRDEQLAERLKEILPKFQQVNLQKRDEWGNMMAVMEYLALAGKRLEKPLLQEALNRALPAPMGESIMTTLAETWMKQGEQRGMQQGMQQALEHERAVILRFASSKFKATADKPLSAFLSRIQDPDRLAEVADWIIECDQTEELLARIGNAGSS